MTAAERPHHGSAVRAMAFALGAIVMLAPAYALPVMHLGRAGLTASDTTILSGVIQLWQQNLGGLATIVFTASFLVPILKLAGLAILLVATFRRPVKQARRLTKLYSTIDFIGRWSMLDIFLVAFLTGAVRFDKLATVEPRIGVAAFGGVVVLTMLATHCFDPRLLWLDSPSSGTSGR